MFREQTCKLGGNISLKIILAFLLDSEFIVDYDFAIKHDPITQITELWNLVSCAKIALSPQNQCHTLNSHLRHELVLRARDMART